MSEMDKLADRSKPCPFCGERLVVKSDHHGEWIGHHHEVGPCWESIGQLFDEDDLKRWNVRATASLSDKEVES